jgi:uncharacterized protein
MTDIAMNTDGGAADSPALDPPALSRIATLDIVRGVAVMGILAMNIVAFAGPFQAYMNPMTHGMEGRADLASWVFSFILVDGKMRGLFSFLFGASTLLVIERAAASGQSPAKIHYMRMIWLLVFGLIHFYFIWWGDILSLYALVGLILYFFRNLSVRALIKWGIALVFVQFLLFLALAVGAMFVGDAAAAPNADAETLRQWDEMSRGFVALSGQQLTDHLALAQGPWSALVEDRLSRQALKPFTSVPMFGWETLGYMLFGMAALKSGFFRGEWGVARYRRTALIGYGITIPVYGALAWLLIRADFTPQSIFAFSFAATVPFRPVMVLATASLVILLTMNGGALVDRIAAAGRAAFTNYLGTSLLMTTIFYGYGLGYYMSLSRVEMWLPVLAAWALMLLWSKPWLDRFSYGPFEWLWRSLSRMRFQPMRKGTAAEA